MKKEIIRFYMILSQYFQRVFYKQELLCFPTKPYGISTSKGGVIAFRIGTPSAIG